MKLALLLLPMIAWAQDAPPPPEMNAAEKSFQDAMLNVKLVGHYTMGDSAELHEDSYTIERVSKVKEETWRFEAKILYNKKDFKVAMNLPVKFAGDTPLALLTRKSG